LPKRGGTDVEKDKNELKTKKLGTKKSNKNSKEMFNND